MTSTIVRQAYGEGQQQYEDAFFDFLWNLKRLGVPMNEANQDGR